MGVIGFAEAVDSFAAALALERGLAEKTCAMCGLLFVFCASEV